MTSRPFEGNTKIRALELKSLATDSASKGDFSKAMELLESALKLNPHDPAIHNNIGYILAIIGRDDLAILAFRKALCYEPTLSQSVDGFCKAALRMNKPEIASQIFEALPSTIDNHCSIQVQILQKIGHSDLALLLASKIPRESYDSDLYLSCTLALLQQNRSEDALRLSVEALGIYPNSIEILCNAASILYELGRTRDALALLGNHSEKAASNSSVLRLVAACYYDLGNISLALESATSAIKLSPECTDIHTLLFNLYAFSGRFSEASRFKRIKQQDSLSPIQSSSASHLPSWSFSIHNAIVLIRRDEGIGDNILCLTLLIKFLEFTPTVRFVVELPDKLLSVFGSIPHERLQIISDSSEFDLSNLTHSLWMSEFTIAMLADPKSTEYLANITPEMHVQNYFVQSVRSRLYERLSCHASQHIDRYDLGIAWKSSNPLHSSAKSIPVSLMLNQINRDIYRSIVSLQYHPAVDECVILEKQSSDQSILIPAVEFYDCIDDLCSFMLACNKVVTVGSIVAHLAGFLGVDTRLLLPPGFSRAYYWSSRRMNISTIYPSLSIYSKKKRMDDWSDAIKNALIS